MKKLTSYLQTFHFYPPELEQAVINILTPDDKKKHDFYWKPNGRVCPYIWYLESGLIRIYQDKNGKEATSYILDANNVFIAPDSSLGGTRPSKMYIQALEPCVAGRALVNDVHKVIDENPGFRRHYILINETYRREDEERKATLLADGPLERIKKLLKDHPDWFKRIPHPIIWEYLGIAKNTFIKHCHDLGI